MKREIFKKLLLFCAISLLAGVISIAEETEEEKVVLPRKGLIAGGMTGAYGGTTLDSQSGEEGIGDTTASPLSGSVSNLGNNNWVAKFMNNSEDRYTASFDVIQYDQDNRRLKSTPMTLSLAANQTVERKFRSSPNAFNCAINLRNWKRFPRKKTPEELKEELEKKETEVKGLEKELGIDDKKAASGDAKTLTK